MCQLIHMKTFLACPKLYKLDPAHFVCVPGLVWQAALNKKKVNL